MYGREVDMNVELLEKKKSRHHGASQQSCCFAKIEHDAGNELNKKSLNEETNDYSALNVFK